MSGKIREGEGSPFYTLVLEVVPFQSRLCKKDVRGSKLKACLKGFQKNSERQAYFYEPTPLTILQAPLPTSQPPQSTPSGVKLGFASGWSLEDLKDNENFALCKFASAYKSFSFIPTSVALHILSYFTFNLLVGPRKGKWEEDMYVKAGSTETSWKISAQ